MQLSVPGRTSYMTGKARMGDRQVWMVGVAYSEGMLVGRSDCGLWSLSNGGRVDCQLGGSRYEHCSPLPAVKAV